MHSFACLAAVALASCAQGDFPVVPEIFVDACAKPDEIVSGRHVGGFEECAVTFTSIPSTQLVRITNPTTIELRLFSVETTNGTFSLEEVAPSTVAAGENVDIAVTASSRSASGDLVITSDAGNTPRDHGTSAHRRRRSPLALLRVRGRRVSSLR